MAKDPFKKMISVSLSEAQRRVMYRVERGQHSVDTLVRYCGLSRRTVELMIERGLIALIDGSTVLRITEWGQFVRNKAKQRAEQWSRARFIRSRGT